MKKLFLLSIVFILIYSCSKSVIGDGVAPSPRVTTMLGTPWSLKSAISIDSLSYGIKHSYKGLSTDTLMFVTGINPNYYVSGLYTNFSGIGNLVGLDATNIHRCSTVSSFDTTVIAYDTLICSGPFRQNYSDTLFVSKVSNSKFIFRVRYSFPNGYGVELDSLYSLIYK